MTIQITAAPKQHADGNAQGTLEMRSLSDQDILHEQVGHSGTKHIQETDSSKVKLQKSPGDIGRKYMLFPLPFPILPYTKMTQKIL